MADTTFHSLTLPGQDTARVPSMAEEFTTETNYEVKDYCTYQGKLYRCITAHEAGGTWDVTHFIETDLDTEFDRKLDIPLNQTSAPSNPRVGDLWIDSDENSPIYNVDPQPILGSTNAVQSGGTKTALNALDERKMEHHIITGDFSESVDYRVGDLVFHIPASGNGITSRLLYRCIADHDSTGWNDAHFTPTTLEIELQRIRDSEADTDMIGDLFGSKSTYAIGDYCVYNTNLYRCIRPIDNTNTNAPSFNDADWVQIKLANEIIDLKKHAEYAIDSLGSVFNTQNELYQYHESIKECPEYTFHFGDFSNIRYKSDYTIASGYSTLNHLIKYDSSMVLKVQKGFFTNESPLYLYLGIIEDNEFSLKNMTMIYDANNMFTNSPMTINLRMYQYIQDQYSEDMYIAFGTLIRAGENAISEYVTLTCNNPFTDLERIQIVHLTNSSMGIDGEKTFFADINGVITHYSEINKNSTNLIRGGWKYLYANGLPIDVIFYDKSGNAITEAAGNLEAFNPSIDYPTCIKIPENAYRYRLAVYSCRKGKNYSNLTSFILEYQLNICAVAKVYHSVSATRDVGRAIFNANKLLNFKYRIPRITTRYAVFGETENPSVSQPINSRAVGFQYGKRSVNVYISYYTYLTLMRHRHGYNASSTTTVNAFYGFVCTGFISAVTGLPVQQGTEWWLQNYADKMEYMDNSTELHVGDLIIEQLYRLNELGKPNLFTHIQLITDVMSDKDTGEFTGYRTAEDNNIWTKSLCKMNVNLIPTLSAADLAQDPNGKVGIWRLHMPVTDILRADMNYRFAIDKTLDTLNNAENIEIPPCVSYLGDMCIIGPHPEGWGALTQNTTIYIEKPYERVKIFRDGNLIGNTLVENIIILPDTSNNIYNICELSSYCLDENENGIPGIYTIYCDNNLHQTTLFIPHYPDVSISNDSKTVTISGVSVRRSNGKVTRVFTESFDEIWFRVIPYPVSSIDGFPEGPPWANYMYVNGTELWDGNNFTVGDKYQYITSAMFINNTFGALDYTFSGDYDPLSDETDDNNGE